MFGKPANLKTTAGADRRAGTATKIAKTTHARDLERQVPAVSGADTGASDVALSTRTDRTAAVRGAKPALKAGRALDVSEQHNQEHRHFQERRCQALDSQRARTRMAEVNAFLTGHAMIAHLHSWASTALVVVLAVGMLVNDPATVYTAVRIASDVPESVGIFDVSNPNVAAALAAAIVVSAVLLGAALGVGKAAATLLFRGRLLPQKGKDNQQTEGPRVQPRPGFPEAEASHRRMGPIQAWTVLIICLGLLIWFAGILHSFAEARFITDSRTAKSNAMVVALVTSLPFGVALFETVAAAPQFDHLRKVGRWALFFRISEWRDVTRDQRFLRRGAALRRAVNAAVISMIDVIRDVGIRSLAEATEAAITTGKVSMADIAKQYRTLPEPASGEGTERPITVDYYGIPSNPYLPGQSAPSNLIANVLNRHRELEAKTTPERSHMAAVWHDFRAAPATYCAIDPAETAPGPASLNGHQSARKWIHSVPDSPGQTAAEESAA
jgi:hypothetical protein